MFRQEMRLNPETVQAANRLSEHLQNLSLRRTIVDSSMSPAEPPSKRRKLDSPSPENPDPSTADNKADAAQAEPAEWIYEDPDDISIAHIPGTAAYYKSLAYRKNHPVDPPQDTVDEDASTPKLIMIFGRTNARRAGVNRKITARMQRYNRRT